MKRESVTGALAKYYVMYMHQSRTEIIDRHMKTYNSNEKRVRKRRSRKEVHEDLISKGVLIGTHIG